MACYQEPRAYPESSEVLSRRCILAVYRVSNSSKSKTVKSLGGSRKASWMPRSPPSNSVPRRAQPPPQAGCAFHRRLPILSIAARILDVVRTHLRCNSRHGFLAMTALPIFGVFGHVVLLGIPLLDGYPIQPPFRLVVIFAHKRFDYSDNSDPHSTTATICILLTGLVLGSTAGSPAAYATIASCFVQTVAPEDEHHI